MMKSVLDAKSWTTNAFPSWPTRVLSVKISGSISVPVDVAEMVSVELNDGDDVPMPTFPDSSMTRSVDEETS